jgi:type I restriction enzyme M protein
LTNRKPEHKKGRVQLIDATHWYTPLRKNLGKKNCQLSEEDIRRICDLMISFRESEQSVILPNEAFGYWKVPVERPLRLRVDLNSTSLDRFRSACREEDEEELAEAVERVAAKIGPGPHPDFNLFLDNLRQEVDDRELNLNANRLKLLKNQLAVIDEAAEPVVKKKQKQATASSNPLEGVFEREIDGEQWVVEYEPDPGLRDTEQVPLLEKGGIEGFFEREVVPYVPDAWIETSGIRKGYEISFTRYFYRPEPLRMLEEIKADIYALEQETDGLLAQIVGEKD